MRNSSSLYRIILERTGHGVSFVPRPLRVGHLWHLGVLPTFEVDAILLKKMGYPAGVTL